MKKLLAILVIACAVTACNNEKAEEKKVDSIPAAAPVDSTAKKVDSAAKKVDSAAVKVDTAAKKK